MKGEAPRQQLRAIACYNRVVIPFCWMLVALGCLAAFVLLSESFSAAFLEQRSFDTTRGELTFFMSLLGGVGGGAVAGLVLRHSLLRPLNKEQLAGLAKMAEENAEVRAYLTSIWVRRSVLRRSVFLRAVTIRRRHIDLQMDTSAKEARRREAKALTGVYRKLGALLRSDR